jgi:bacterioferritin-associated ferredoxin
VYVCHCRAVTDRDVRAAIEAGARSPRELARDCGAGAECRACWAALWELVDQEVGIWGTEYEVSSAAGPMLAR